MNLPIERVALGRISFGARSQELQAIRNQGLAAFVEEQLHPDDTADPDCDRVMKAARLHIEYGENKDDKGKVIWPALKQNRPLSSLTASVSELWKLNAENVSYDEKVHPMQQVRAGMWIRAVHSRWQLREVLVDFWHNHFNVNGFIDDPRVQITFPTYDRQVIRRHCLGNFREFLGAVARSVPMLCYLNNVSSKASPANENYARELFELHTLGASAYYNHLYNRWRDVPGGPQGKPVGYIDQDVYEAARAFTGWTVADGTETDRGEKLPSTGEFHYYAAWHDPYQKRVLGVEFDPNAAPMADGNRVLDLVARHPATARFIATKLCRRLVCESPSDALITMAADMFSSNADQPDQIARTLRAIILSEEFAATSGQRVKKPFELAVSLLRATGAEITFHGDNDDSLLTLTDTMGQFLFNWPTPTGHPENASHWLGTGAMLARWNCSLSMTSDDYRPVSFHLLRQTPTDLATWRQVGQYWVDRMIGQKLADDVMSLILSRLSDGADIDSAPRVSDKVMIDRLTGLVCTLSMLPEFQWC